MQSYYYNLENEQFDLFRDFTLEELLKQKNETRLNIIIPREMENMEEKLDNLLSKLDGTKVFCNNVIMKYDVDYISSGEEIENLKAFAEYFETKNLGISIQLKELRADFDNFLVAKQEIESFVDKVNNLTIEENGAKVPLSPIEKFVVAYEYVANRVYNEDENFFNEDMRNWIGVLTGDKIICTGYSSLLKCICDYMFNPNELICETQGLEVFDKNNNSIGMHEDNVIIINDPKYNLCGMYITDACWGSPQGDKKVSFEYAMLPLTKIFEHKNNKFLFDEGIFLYKELNPDIEPTTPRLKNENKLISREEPIVTDLFNIYGLSPLKEMKQQLNFQKQKEIEREKIEAINEQKELEILEKLNVIETEYNLQNVMATNFPSMLSLETSAKFPILNEMQEYFKQLNFDSLDDIDILKLREYCTFLNNNRDNLKSIVNISMKEQIKHSILQKEKISALDHILVDRVIQQFNEQYHAQEQYLLDNAKDFLYTAPIDERALYNGLRGVAQLKGLQKTEEIEKFAYDSLALTRELSQKTFEHQIEQQR
ncbi:MAG: hypothetical protein IJ301_03210 [Clostridia bacterium]|nr:hypothetical protein [Clostridia bacterium]